MANTQKEKLNDRQVRIKSDLEFGVINPLKYDINSKTFSLKTDSTLDIDDTGRLTVVPASEYDWDINWHAEDMPQNVGWTRTATAYNPPTTYLVVNEEEIETDGVTNYLALNISKSGGDAPGDHWFYYSHSIIPNITDGFIIHIKTNWSGMTGSGGSATQAFAVCYQSPTGQGLIIVNFAVNNVINIYGNTWNGDVFAIDPRSTHVWRVRGYTVGSDTFIQLWCDGTLVSSITNPSYNLRSTFNNISIPSVLFGASILGCYGVGGTVIYYEYFRAKLGLYDIYTIILASDGSVIGGESYEWLFDSAVINNNLTVGGTFVLDTLNGILKTTSGIVSAITNGSSNQILGVNNAGTDHEYKTIQGTTNQVTITLTTPNIITISLPQNINTRATPQFDGITFLVNCNSGVAIRDIIYVDGSNTWQKAKADNLTTTFATGIVLSKPSSTTALILKDGIYKDFSTGMTSGIIYYLSISSAGLFQTTTLDENYDNTKYIVIIGRAINATDLQLNFQEPIYIQ